MGADSALFRNGALAVAGLGTGLDVLGGLRSTAEQSAAAEHNARVYTSEARAVDRQTAAQFEMKTREVRQVLARQRSLFGVSGFAPTGSLVAVAADSAEAGFMDALAIRYGGEAASAKARAAARWTRTKADNTRTAGYIGAGTSLLAGAATTAKLTIR